MTPVKFAGSYLGGSSQSISVTPACPPKASGTRQRPLLPPTLTSIRCRAAAASRIQSLWRGCQTRKRVRFLKPRRTPSVRGKVHEAIVRTQIWGPYNESHEKAVTQIQRVWRGHVVRKAQTASGKAHEQKLLS